MRTVTTAADLVTPTANTISGFARQAEQKASLGNQYQRIADYFVQNAARIRNVDEILDDPQFLEFALGACALSKKSLNYLDHAARVRMISALIDISRLDDSVYVHELEQRYLLTCGDSVGGSMRNIIGQTAQNLLSGAIFDSLTSQGLRPVPSLNSTGKILTIDWTGSDGNRRLVFDKKSPLVEKSIDFILLKNTLSLGNPSDYVACGELKGGIDPAGADEHWKTARAALNRIEVVFPSCGLPIPKLFFVGAAIERAMAEEIFGRLRTGELLAAANLTIPDQLEELVAILISL